MLAISAMAPVQLVRAALPGMVAADEGTVITVASLLAFSAGQTDPRMPHRSIYAAAKAATVAFTRLLAHELAGTAIRTQVVCPGMVATEFNQGAGQRVPFAMSAEDVAAASLAGVRLGETVCVPGLEEAADMLDALLAAETAVQHGNRPSLASRYRQPLSR